MTVNDFIHVFAGSFILISLALGVQASPMFHSANWLWFTAFVGANLFQFGLTGFCPMGFILKKFGVKETCATAS
ncbi:MAG: DUF2892 domain-containing protein [Proteobacteria bacterium]|nr:DUF2892 domain-containing protein [Pseudomonadota bacterium]